ncbi:g5274 [Coccomyxa elongata]
MQPKRNCALKNYQRFWPALGQELTDVLHEAFTTEASPALPPSLLQGRITLLYKGKGADRDSPASYRPITLLNTDYKLAARTLASRLGPVLNHVVDATQTGFLPKRWVGDNVLAHLEEISHLQETQEPGVMVFLDFEKAFDRLDRAWIERCMAAVGFGPGAQRWVHILHSGTTARVAYNGWHTDDFPVRSGVFQGSPLSPLLFVLATQPMAAHARRLAQQQAFQSIRLPSGAPAPVMHQHADDTSIHARSTTDAQWPRCRHRSHLRSTGGEREALGTPLSNEPADAATALFTAILQKMEARIARWSGFRLSLLGRAYVAKQVLASMVTYHATFIPVPEHLMARLCRALHTFVTANRPVIGGTQAPLFPGKEACFRAPKDGGIALVDIWSQISALQAKVIGRLLEPELLAWKAFFDFWLYRSPAWITAQGQATLDARHQHIWQLGRFLLFSTFDASRLQAPPRVRKYVESYQQLQPHRLIQPDSLSFHATMIEPLFLNRQLRDADGLPFAWEDWARQGLVRISDLRSLVHALAPHDASFRQRIQTLLAALPEPWHRLVRSEPPAAQWLASPDNSDRRVWSRSAGGHYTCTHTASTSGALIPVEPAAAHQQAIMPASVRPALVQGWDITRPWHPRSGASQQQQQQQEQQGQPDQNSRPQQQEPEPSSPYLLGIWGAHVIDPHSWGMGRRRAHEYVVKEASTRRQVLDRKAAGDEHAAASMRPPIWADSTDDQRSGLRAIEEGTRRLAAQTFSWRTTSGHGGQLPSSGPSGTACGWPLSTSFWAAYQRARHQPDAAQSAGAVAARILSSSRKALLGDWRLATVTIRQTAGVLSDWLRGRDPKLTREAFRERWCHRDILCVLGAEPDAQLLIHWSAQHPVPLPA